MIAFTIMKQDENVCLLNIVVARSEEWEELILFYSPFWNPYPPYLSQWCVAHFF